MAVADASVVVSSGVVEKGGTLKNLNSVGEVTRRNLENLNLPDDSQSTISSTASSGFAHSVSGFLINRRAARRKSSSRSPARMASFSKNLKHVARVSSRNLNISLARSKLYNSFPNLHRKENQIQQNGYSIDDENVRKVLKAVESDHVVSTNVADNRNRRTVYIEKFSNAQKFGFTIQSYTFRHGKTNKTEQITYVDYVDLDCPAYMAGLRAGDIILAINGRNVQNETHQQLVNYIGRCSSVRMVVLFENCVNRIELCARAIKLKKLLADKEFELRVLRCQEERILSGMAPFKEVEILALLRTPCNTPRSVSFALPNKKSSSEVECMARRPSAPVVESSAQIYYVNEEEDDSKLDTEEGGLETESVVGDRSSSSWEAKKASFEVGSDGASSCMQSSSLGRSLSGSQSDNFENDNYNDDDAISDLALIHILHIDDATTPPSAAVSNEISSVAVTRF